MILWFFISKLFGRKLMARNRIFMIKIIYDGKDLKEIEKEIFQSFDFVYKIFSLEISDIVVHVYDTRAEFNKELKRETENWFVACAFSNGDVYILSPIAIEKESNHQKEEFSQILKHEFTHSFVANLAKGNCVPRWLNEGLASYVAKQHQKKEKLINLENNFCENLSTPEDWNKRVKNKAYSISAFFVRFLIEKYSFEKINKLISSVDKEYDYQKFRDIFSSVYGENLEEIEKSFISANC